jgi:hypothetical protein
LEKGESWGTSLPLLKKYPRDIKGIERDFLKNLPRSFFIKRLS